MHIFGLAIFLYYNCILVGMNYFLSQFPGSLVVKARVAVSDEEDFVEVDVENATYVSLLHACCLELGLEDSKVVKIRKLPNVLVRKDKDVQRLSQGQEIELVLATE